MTTSRPRVAGMVAASHLNVILEEDGVVVRGGRVERFSNGGDKAAPLDAVVDLLGPEWPVHLLIIPILEGGGGGVAQGSF